MATKKTDRDGEGQSQFIPSEKDIEDAKMYARRRMEEQRIAMIAIEKYLLEAARRIIDIAFKYNIPPSQFQFSENMRLKEEVDAVLQALLKSIMEEIEEAVVMASPDDDEEDRKMLLFYLYNIGDHQSVIDIAIEYIERFRYELEAFIAAGLFYGLSKAAILEEIRNNLQTPYNSELLRKAFKERVFKAVRIREKGVSFGKGQYVAAKNSIKRLLDATVGIVWWWWQTKVMKESGAEYYMQMRGSDYPCDICDDEAGVHPIEEIDTPYPHAHCYCIRVII